MSSLTTSPSAPRKSCLLAQLRKRTIISGNSALYYGRLQEKLEANLYFEYEREKYFVEMVLPDITIEKIKDTHDLKKALYRAKHT